MEEVLNGRWVGFHTHVAPVDVSVDNSFREPGGATASVVDGAQSLGTSLTEELVSSGTVVIAPLHKHLALTPGLGIVILDAVTGQQLPSIASFLSLTEGGCPSLDLLEQALDRMRRGKVWNKAQLLFSQDLVDWAAAAGRRARGASGVGVVLMRSRSSNSSIVINDLSSTPGLRQAISNDLINQLESNPHRQYWQYAKVPDDGNAVPGIVVASQLTLPLAGTYNVFLVYSLNRQRA